jgi:predicted nucleic acid-binding protein
VRPRYLCGLGDTNILIYLERLAVDQLPAELLTSTVTLAELSAGVHSADDAVERARRVMRVQRVEATFNPLPFDVEAARQYGIIAAEVISMGHKPQGRVADLMIASIAAANRNSSCSLHRLPQAQSDLRDSRAARGARQARRRPGAPPRPRRQAARPPWRCRTARRRPARHPRLPRRHPTRSATSTSTSVPGNAARPGPCALIKCISHRSQQAQSSHHVLAGTNARSTRWPAGQMRDRPGAVQVERSTDLPGEAPGRPGRRGWRCPVPLAQYTSSRDGRFPQ